MNLSDLISKLAQKVGLNPADPKFAGVIALTADIPEDIATKILSSLLTTEEAKNNADLKAYFKAQVYDGVDSQLKTLMSELNLDTDSIAELVAERNTNERVNKLVKKVQTLEGKKAQASGTEKSELQGQINRLNEEKAAIIKAGKDEKEQMLADFNGKLNTMTIRSLLSGKKYSNKDLPQDVNVETAFVILNRDLQSAGAKIVNQNGTLVLKQLKDNDLDWYGGPTNEKLSIEQFIDSSLAASKLLAVNDAGSGNANSGGQGSGNTTAPLFINGDGKGNPSLVSANDANLRELEASLK